ncbi:MAG: capsular biosynthesis protein CpsI, partial [Burkholderiales bacterium]
YVDDIVEGIVRVIGQPAAPAPGWSGDHPDPATSYAPWRIFNIGNNQPVKLMRYIEVLEQCLGKKARLDLLPMQVGDVPATSADTGELQKAVGYKPHTPIETGIRRFADWYRTFYRDLQK